MLGMGLCGFLTRGWCSAGADAEKARTLCVYGAVSAFAVYGIRFNAYSALLATGTLTWQSLAVYCASGFRWMRCRPSPRRFSSGSSPSRCSISSSASKSNTASRDGRSPHRPRSCGRGTTTSRSTPAAQCRQRVTPTPIWTKREYGKMREYKRLRTPCFQGFQRRHPS